MKKLLLVLMAILLTGFVTGCGGGGGGSAFDELNAVTLQSIEVTPVGPSLAKGLTQQFTAMGIYSDSTKRDLTTQVDWSSSNEDVATINASGGLATGVSDGSSTITATITTDDGTFSGTSNLTVTSAVITEINIDQQEISICTGISQQFTVTGIFSDNTTQDLTTQVIWGSLDTGTATITGGGLAYGVKAGSAIITATITTADGTFSDTSTLTVTSATLQTIEVTADYLNIAIGVKDQLYATGYDSDGYSYDLTAQVAWTSSNTGVATISIDGYGDEWAYGVSAGNSLITATLGSVSGSMTLYVTTATLSYIDVTPAAGSIAKGTTQQFTATGYDSDANSYDLTAQVTWSSSNTGVATISNTAPNNGLATSLTAGSSTITATLGSLSDTAALTVKNITLNSITVTPAGPSSAVGWPLQFTATGNFSDSTTQDLTKQVTWLSSVSSVAHISNNYATKGLATPTHTGTTTIYATFVFGGVSVIGQTTLTVSTASLSSISVSCSPNPVDVGGTSKCTATGNFSGGFTQDITNYVNTTWTSSNNGVATVVNVPKKNKGRAKGISSGSVTITANDRKGKISGTTTLAVN